MFLIKPSHKAIYWVVTLAAMYADINILEEYSASIFRVAVLGQC
jgi:hypothetical protein